MTCLSEWQFKQWKAKGHLPRNACKRFYTGYPVCPHGKQVDKPCDFKECKTCKAKYKKGACPEKFCKQVHTPKLPLKRTLDPFIEAARVKQLNQFCERKSNIRKPETTVQSSKIAEGGDD